MKTAPELGRTQLFWFFMHAQIGVGLFSLPYSIYKHAQTDGWISLLIAGVVVQLVFFFLYALHKRFPRDSLFTICEKASGKSLARCLLCTHHLLSVDCHTRAKRIYTANRHLDFK